MQAVSRINRIILCSLAFTLLISGLPGCKTQKDSKSGVSGVVAIDGGVGDGVTVDVFRTYNRNVWYDQALPPRPHFTAWGLVSRTSQGSSDPIVGVNFSWMADFDWRQESAIASAVTGGDGTFSISDLADGDYVFVAHKDGFGWTLPMTVAVRGQALELGTVTLFPESTRPDTTIGGGLVFRAGHHYVLSDNLIVQPGEHLAVEPAAVIRVRNESRIVIGGSLFCEGTPDSFITFTAEVPDLYPASWRYINFQESADEPVHFRYTKIEYAKEAIRSSNQTSAGIVEYCYFRKLFNLAVDVSGSTNIRYAHNVIDSVNTGLRAFQCDHIDIEHNLFFNCNDYAIQLDGGQLGAFGDSIYCNWFYQCGGSDSSGQAGTIYLSNIHALHVAYNNTEGSNYAINLGSRVDSTVLIVHNRYATCSRVLNIGSTPQAYGPTYPFFQFNSMDANRNLCVAMSACEHNVRNVQAGNNFWTDSQDNPVNPRDVILDGSDPNHDGCGLVISDPISTVRPVSGLCNSN